MDGELDAGLSRRLHHVRGSRRQSADQHLVALAASAPNASLLSRPVTTGPSREKMKVRYGDGKPRWIRVSSPVAAYPTVAGTRRAEQARRLAVLLHLFVPSSAHGSLCAGILRLLPGSCQRSTSSGSDAVDRQRVLAPRRVADHGEKEYRRGQSTRRPPASLSPPACSPSAPVSASPAWPRPNRPRRRVAVEIRVGHPAPGGSARGRAARAGRARRTRLLRRRIWRLNWPRSWASPRPR